MVELEETLHPGADVVAAWHAEVRERAAKRYNAGISAHEKRIVIAAIAVTVLAHMFAAWWLQRLMHPHAVVDEDRIEVRLLDDVAQPPLPVPQQRASVPAPAAPSMTAPRPTPAPSAAARIESAPTQLPLQLLDTDGTIRLPAEKKPQSFGSKHAREMASARELMRRGHNMLHCHRKDNPHPSPDEIANNSARGREMYSGMFHYPAADAMLDRASTPRIVADTREAVADKEALAQAVCDETVYDGPIDDEPVDNRPARAEAGAKTP